MELELTREVTTKTKAEIAKDKALELAIGSANKKLGKGSVIILGESKSEKWPSITSGSPQLDKALGIGGWPKGRMIEIYGPESSGKTTLALHAMAECQKAGGTAAFIDVEHALDPTYARNLGVDTDKLVFSQPMTGEGALEAVDILVRSNVVDMIVVDSVAALVPRAELEGEMGKSHVGLQSRLMSQAMRKLTGAVASSECIVIFINQIREKVGVMFGNPEVTPGGRALKFYSSVRVEIRRAGAGIRMDEELIGNNIKVKIVKNKMAPPYVQYESRILYGQGIDVFKELLDLSVDKGLIEKSSSWYQLGTFKVQGDAKAAEYLRENEELANELRAELLKDEPDNESDSTTEGS